MHQFDFQSLLSRSSALVVTISVVVLVPSLNTSIQPYGKDLAFHRCCRRAFDVAKAFATRLHTGRGAL